jgi:FdhD protein
MESPSIRDFGVRRHVSMEKPANDVDHLAVEEPLQIVLRFRRQAALVRKPISITMRTPGQDRELAVGFLYTEGILHDRNSIEGIDLGADSSITITVAGKLDLQRLERHFYTSSSCGVCGKASLQALQMNREIRLDPSRPRHSVEFLVRTPGIVREKQSIFERTGGLHAAALFDPDRNLIRICEDIGRHNAVDKLIGAELLAGRTDFSDLLLFVSGRAGFELIQKSIMSGIPFMVAVGAPSSLSVELAREYGSTLVGFLRENRFNLYSGSDRVLETEKLSVAISQWSDQDPQ